MRDRLLHLLRVGQLVNCVDVGMPPFSEAGWTELFSLAKEQAVTGVCLEAIEKLPAECRPPQPLLLKWIALAEQVRRQNAKVDAVLAELVREWQEIGIQPIVVKGQIVAREYPRPEHRHSGDIDVLIQQEQWNRIEKWMREKGLDYKRSAAEKHIEVKYKDVNVELHYHLNAFSTKRVQDYWERNIEERTTENSRWVSIGGYEVRTLGATETLLHLMVHIHHHLLTEGVGLRQLMDMALFMNNHTAPLQLTTSGGRDEEIDYSLLKKHLIEIGHYKAFTAYCALMNKYLGLEKEKIPFELDLEDYVFADKIMDEVWRGGNFGHKNNLKGVKPGLLHSLNTAALVIRHSWKFYRLAPKEARGYWWNKIFWRMKRK